MPRDVEHDVPNYHNLTPVQRAALAGLVARQAKAARAQAMRQAIAASARALWSALLWGFDGVRPLGAAVRDRAVRPWQRHQQRRLRRATAAQLYALDDRALKDIGLHRGEIDFVLSGVADPTRVPRQRGAGQLAGGTTIRRINTRGGGVLDRLRLPSQARLTPAASLTATLKQRIPAQPNTGTWHARKIKACPSAAGGVPSNGRWSNPN